MSESGVKGFRLDAGLAINILAVAVALVSLVMSAVTYYDSSLKPPELSFVTAPYIKQVVDNQSLNEAFFIPLTVTNRGARPGTLLSFELTVTHLPTGERQTYFGQYFTQDNSQTDLGAFFSPITLNGYSSAAYTVCFYPLGQRPGSFLAHPGAFEFQLVAKVANVRGAGPQTTANTFRITVDDAMLASIQSQPDQEYIYPMAIEALP